MVLILLPPSIWGSDSKRRIQILLAVMSYMAILSNPRGRYSGRLTACHDICARSWRASDTFGVKLTCSVSLGSYRLTHGHLQHFIYFETLPSHTGKALLALTDWRGSLLVLDLDDWARC